MSGDIYGEHLRKATEGYKVLAMEVMHFSNVECVEMPCCGFLFSADHTDDGSDPPTYTCPLCHALRPLG